MQLCRERLHIAVLVDESTVQQRDPQFTGPAVSPYTEFHAVKALRCLGYAVSVVPACEDPAALAAALAGAGPDLVFNLTEEFRGDRLMDKNIVCLLEMLGLPYTGTGPAGLMLCRDKRLCKQMLSCHNIRVPGFISIPRNRFPKIPRYITYPMVVKPVFEDGSVGISNASLVNNDDALRRRAEFIHSRLAQPVIAEEYIPGRELYVSLLGNGSPAVLPVRQCSFDFGGRQGRQGPQMATYSVKWNALYRKKWNIHFGFAQLKPAMVKKIGAVCKKAFNVLQMRDYARIDLRITPANELVVIEANPNPDIAFGEEVAESARKAGIKYEHFIDKIVRCALKRYHKKQSHK